jgi:hypothetical protein
VADIFVSYTSQDRAWAEWIGQELKKLGHVVNIQDWAVAADGIQERQKIASHVLCVISEAHLKSPYFNPEEKIARWAASSQRSNFLLLAFIEPCEVPPFLAGTKRCSLYDLNEHEAQDRLRELFTPTTRRPPSFLFPKQISQPVMAGSILDRKTLPEDADFFISRAGADSVMGLKICAVLEGLGFRCLLENRDFGNQNYMGVMNAALKGKARIVAVLSEKRTLRARVDQCNRN